MGTPVGPRRALLAGVFLAIVGVVVVGGRATEVHSYGWEWTLSPSAAPPKIHFEGRDYDRGGKPSGGLPPDAVLKGETLGGGQIFTSGSASGTSTLVYVKDGRAVHVYGLMGGP